MGNESYPFVLIELVELDGKCTHMLSSWEESGKWYDKIVGKEGHYYHKSLILPNVLRLLELKTTSSLLDLACGQGVLSRHLPPEVTYLGIDSSPSLIQSAQKHASSPHHKFLTCDLSQPVVLEQKNFSHAAILLGLQNLENGACIIRTAGKHLSSQGRLILVLNHPCFRIPRQSSWQVDADKKLQFRRMDTYLSPHKIPIYTHPSQKQSSPKTWSFHYPLSTYSLWLKEGGFAISEIEEWCSDKTSYGKTASMENRSRKEFPLFLTICAIRLKEGNS